MAKCPTCGEEVASPEKQWEWKGRVQAKGKPRGATNRHNRNVILIQQFRCPNCGKSFRKGTPIKEVTA